MMYAITEIYIRKTARLIHNLSSCGSSPGIGVGSPVNGPFIGFHFHDPAGTYPSLPVCYQDLSHQFARDLQYVFTLVKGKRQFVAVLHRLQVITKSDAVTKLIFTT
jgi:hypothetical protein